MAQIAFVKPQWQTVHNMITRANADPTDVGGRLSIDDADVPTWQREATAWNKDQRGLLAMSLIQGYPIGQILLWEKPGKIYVPIDGRQRLSAILAFRRGDVTIPDDRWIDEEFRGRRYCKGTSVTHDHSRCLSVQQMNDFDSYQLDITSFEPETPPSVLMDMFVRLQGGTPLNKAEVRAALGTPIANYVTELTTSGPQVVAGEDVGDDDEVAEATRNSAHPFFRSLSVLVRNRRKIHRQICDQLLNEFLKGDILAEFSLDNHWETLSTLYRTHELSEAERKAFYRQLTSFRNAFSKDGKLSAALKSANQISTWFRVWRYMHAHYATKPRIDFFVLSQRFEAERSKRKDEQPYKDYATALSASGYTAPRNRERARIIRHWLLEQLPKLEYKDPKRLFSIDQKWVIWYRADGQCEWVDPSGSRCVQTMDAPEGFDAHYDHVFRHTEGGKTTVENGQLLCSAHNLSKH